MPKNASRGGNGKSIAGVAFIGIGLIANPRSITLQNEKQFQVALREYAELMGWKVFATWHSIHSPKGEPDLRLVRPPRVVFAELKSERGKLTPSQAEVISLLEECPGIEVYLWRPSDWDAIERVLA